MDPSAGPSLSADHIRSADSHPEQHRVRQTSHGSQREKDQNVFYGRSSQLYGSSLSVCVPSDVRGIVLPLRHQRLLRGVIHRHLRR